MESDKSLERLIERRIQEYEGSKSVRGMSQEEIINVASKLKRGRISSERINEIGVDAETHFREVLKSRNPELFNLYIQLKTKMIKGGEAKGGWESIEESIDEKAIKREYIDSRISVGQDEIELIHKAIREITTRGYQERFRLLNEELGERSTCFVLDLESRINQVNYPNYFNEKLLSSLKEESPVEFVYLICLRYKHRNGVFGVSPNLEPFSFQDINGNLQRRDGSSKIFQLDTAMNLSLMSSDISSVAHKIVVMDTDLSNFLAAKSDSKAKVEEYIQSVRGYVGDTLDVIPASKYFGSLGFDELEYEGLVDSLIKNKEFFFTPEEYSELLNKNANKVSRTLKWNNPQNEFYTASSISRNILIGKTISQMPNSIILSIYNKNASIGSQFNIKSQNPVVLMALPIYRDNVGSIEYA
jgi:hypothetical protein